jgi:hypothetical protein
MSKLAIVLTAVICLPLGAVLQHSASAQKMVNGIDAAFPTDGPHAHFDRAGNALRDAQREIHASQNAHEDIWSGDATHGIRVRDAIEQAMSAAKQTYRWVHAAGIGYGYGTVYDVTIYYDAPGHRVITGPNAP